MKKVIITGITGLLLAATAAVASEEGNPPPQNGQKPPKEKNPAFEKALKECSDANGKERGERPDMAKMDKCMEDKGFKKPPHPPKDECRPDKPAN